MLKTIFFVMLVVNIVLFGMIKGLWGPKASESHEPLRIQSQINSTQLQLISAVHGDNNTESTLASTTGNPAATETQAQLAAPSVPTPAPAVTQTAANEPATPVKDPAVTAPVAIPAETPPKPAVVAEPALPPEPAAPVTPPKVAVNKATDNHATTTDPAKNNNLACVEAGYFVLTDARRFETQINRIPIGMKEVRKSVEEVVSYMVRIPANNGQIGANRRAAELQKAGIHDYYIVPGTYSIDSLRWSVSLGVFKTETAAKSYMRDLTAKGIKQMVITPRKATSSKIAYQFKNVTPAQRSQIDKVMNGFSAQDLHRC